MGVTDSLRGSIEELATRIAASVKDGTRREVNGVVYKVEDVTWPVSRIEDGSEAFHCPRPQPALLRQDALFVDVRGDYWDGWATYRPSGERFGRWRWFRMSSPGERGYDLHIATDGEIASFAEERTAVLEAFGLKEGKRHEDSPVEFPAD